MLGLGTFVRADAVLLTPALLFLLYRNTGAIGPAVKWAAAFGLVMAASYGAIIAFDPRSDDAMLAVANYMTSGEASRVISFMIWTMSPIPLLLAIWGLRALAASKPGVCVSLILWLAPTLLFYAPAATTSRYFLNIVVPLAIAAGVGLQDLATRLQPNLGSLTARAAVVGLASATCSLASDI